VAETLTVPGYQVIEAGDGASAIYALMSAPGDIDVVLLDLVLPDYRDLSLLAVLRRMVPTFPIIMMTAFATPELVERARMMGALTVVNKPFEMNDLAPLIGRALRASIPAFTMPSRAPSAEAAAEISVLRKNPRSPDRCMMKTPRFPGFSTADRWHVRCPTGRHDEERRR
jgi:DNA-binding response OmpR family regulator